MEIYHAIGKETFEAVIRDFYDKVFDDVMIGYFFHGKDKEQLIRHQIQFTSQILGAPPVPYEGKPIQSAHQSLKGLRRPHFHRRQQILKETLEEHKVETNLINGWLQLENRLLPLVLTNAKSLDCAD